MYYDAGIKFFKFKMKIKITIEIIYKLYYKFITIKKKLLL